MVLSPSIIHRDLTARNVLLNSAMVAKIADLGVARIVNLQPDQLATMTQGPGNIVYMPPEAMGEHTQYNTSLDIFSFGNISLFTLTQEFIGPKLKAATYTDGTGKINARSEIERREYGFCIIYRGLGKDNVLAQLTRDCLQNHPAYRPNAADLVERIKRISSDMVLPSKLDLMKQLSSKEKENKEMADEIKLLQDVMSSQRLTLQTQSSIQRKEIETKDTQLIELQKVIHTQEEQIQDIQKRLADMMAQGSVSREEARQFQAQINKMKPAHDEVIFPLTFKWEKQNNLPHCVSTTDSCIINGKMYINIGGSFLLEYASETDTWINLLVPTTQHGLVSLNGKLTLVGGLMKESTFTFNSSLGQ